MTHSINRISVNHKEATKHVLVGRDSKFLGDIIAKRNDGLNQVMMNAYSIAVLTGIECYENKPFVFTTVEYDDLSWFEDYIEEINAAKTDSDVANIYLGAIDELVNTYEQYNVADSSVPSAPSTSTMRASKSGKVEYKTNEAYQNGSTRDHSAVSVKVGGGMENRIRKLIAAQTMALTYIALAKLPEQYYAIIQEGTNFNRYGLGITASS
tara:strand:- start:182 stop:811 length:630 start_codon:yes stop_codon:yes gene_type:complete